MEKKRKQPTSKKEKVVKEAKKETVVKEKKKKSQPPQAKQKTKVSFYINIIILSLPMLYLFTHQCIPL